MTSWTANMEIGTRYQSENISGTAHQKLSKLFTNLSDADVEIAVNQSMIAVNQSQTAHNWSESQYNRSGIIFNWSSGIRNYSGIIDNYSGGVQNYSSIIDNFSHIIENQSKIEMLIIQSGVATGNGNVGGTTIVDAGLTEGDDFWNGNFVAILGGNYEGQVREIADFDAASDTLTVHSAFSGQIVDTVPYVILPGIGQAQLFKQAFTNQSVIDTNFSAAVLNRSTIALEIATNFSRVDVDLDRNISSIVFNTSVTSFNQSVGSFNQSVISYNQSRIVLNQSAIAANTSALAAQQSAGDLATTTNQSVIIANTSQLFVNQSQLFVNQSQLFVNQSLSIANQSAIVGRIYYNESGIFQNYSHILENQSLIIRNYSAIFDNQSGLAGTIETNYSAIIANYSQIKVNKSSLFANLVNLSQLFVNQSQLFVNQSGIIFNLSALSNQQSAGYLSLGTNLSAVIANQSQAFVNLSRLETLILYQGTITSTGTTTVLPDTALTQADDFWNGAIVVMQGGTQENQVREISDFATATDTITVNPAFDGVIASGTKYAIITGIGLRSVGETNYSHILENQSFVVQNYSAIIDNYSHILENQSDIYEILVNASQLFVNQSLSIANQSALAVDIYTNYSVIVKNYSAIVQNYSSVVQNYSRAIGNNKAWKKQACAVLDQIPPVQNTWYDILATTADVKLLFVAVRQKNDEAAAKTCQIDLVIDGISYNEVISLADNTWYYAYILPYVGDVTMTTTVFNVAYYAPLCGQSVQVQVRITAAVGTNQELHGAVHYETWEAT